MPNVTTLLQVSSPCDGSTGLAPFTTREIAVGLWTLGFAVWVATYPAVRKSFRQLIRVAFDWKLVAPFLAAAAYTVLMVRVLWYLGLWNQELLKDTVLWFVFAGSVLAFSGVQAGKQLNWSKIVGEQLKIIVLVEWMVNTYTFSLPIELLLVPILVAVALFDAVARTDAKYSAVATLTGLTQGMFGIGVLAFAVREAVLQWGKLAPADALRSVLLAPLLSLMILPFVYSFALVSAYEQLFLKLKFGDRKDTQVICYTKRRLIKHLGVRLSAVQSFTQAHALDLIRLKSRADADRLFVNS